MKNILLIAGFCLVSFCTFAQDIPQSQVPSVIVNAFKQSFPKASDVEWELKGELYEVEFEIGFVDHKARYSNTGKLTWLKHDIKPNELPAEVNAAIQKDFSGYRISDAEKIDEPGIITYKMDLKKMNEEWKVIFDSKGKLLNKIAD